jgi:TonB family protein
MAALLISFKPIERESFDYIPIAISFFEEAIAPAPRVEPAAPAVATAQTPAIAAAGRTIEDKNETDGALTIAELNALFAPAAPSEPPIETPKETIDETGGALAVEATELGELYGLTIRDLTPSERRFLEQNLNPIQTITQRYLWQRGYPRLAEIKGMRGVVVLGFTLMPNGDITPVEVIKSSGWSLLDDHARDTILVAYKDYPRPIEPVRVRMRVTYR